MKESQKSNWIGVSDGQYAWSSSGELWGTPLLRLNSSNAVNGRFALGSVVHEIRADGTLWTIGERGQFRVRYPRRVIASGVYINGYSPNGNAPTPNSTEPSWRRIGDRSDWASVWGSEETYYGLTSDGTVWVWGIDWGQKPISTLKDRLTYLREEIRRPFATRGNQRRRNGRTPSLDAHSALSKRTTPLNALQTRQQRSGPAGAHLTI